MKIRELSCDEITVIYNKRLIKDFIKEWMQGFRTSCKVFWSSIYHT